jgi:hypothetical protein
MDCLSKEQLLLLQHNLTYEVYEKFMGLFFQDELLPVDEKSRELYILKTMKEHDYWGEIKGWGDKRVYKNIAQINKLNCYFPNFQGKFGFKGTTKKELIEFLDEFRIDYHIHNDLLLPVSDDDEEENELKGTMICGNCCYTGKLKEENVIMPCINCAEENNWMFKGKPCLGGYPGADCEGNMIDHIEITPEELAALTYNQVRYFKDGIFSTDEEKILYLPPHVIEIYKTLYL